MDEWEFDASIDVDASHLDPDLKAILPQGVQKGLDAVDATFDGRVMIDGARLTVSDARRSFSGTVSVERAGANVALPLREAVGLLDVRYEAEGDSSGKVQIDVRIRSAEVADVGVTRGRASVEIDPESGEVRATGIRGDCHGGRLAGDAGVTVDSGSQGQIAWGDFQLSGVRFEALRSDLAGEAGNTSEAGQPELAAALQQPQEKLDANIVLSSSLGEGRLQGRGVIRVAGGRVIDQPFLLRLVEASSLEVPRNDTLDQAQASFYIDGDVVTLEDISLFSNTVAFYGYGTMGLENKDVNLRFSARRAKPIPIISEVLSGISSEFLTIAVQGPLPDAEMTVERFSGTRRMLSGMIAPGQGEQERRLRDIERQAQRSRLRKGATAAVPPVESN
mgnify:FL=1